MYIEALSLGIIDYQLITVPALFSFSGAGLILPDNQLFMKARH